MKDNYELKNPKPNPYSERMKNGYTIIIDRNSNDDNEEDVKETKNNVKPQTKWRRSLA